MMRKENWNDQNSTDRVGIINGDQSEEAGLKKIKLW